MNKKNHTLRQRVIWTVSFTVVTWVLILLGTILYGSFNEGGDVVPQALNWFNEFGTYLAAFDALKDPNLWNFTHVLSGSLWYAGIVLSIFAFVTTLFVAIGKKSSKYVFASILNLVLCAGILYAFLGFYYTDYLNPNYMEAGTLPGKLFNLIMFKDTAHNVGWAIYGWGIIISVVFSIFGVIAIYIVTLRRLFKKEKVAIADQVTSQAEIKAVETTKEETTVQEQPKKKGVIVIRRFDKYGKTGPVLEAKDSSTYPNETIVQKSLTTEEIREVIRDEFERQEALKLAEQYKEEKNVQLIAEAIVKATNGNKTVEEAPKADEACACSSKDNEEEQTVYPSPIVFAMPASTAETPKRVKKVAPVKTETKPKLSESRIKEIIAEEIAKALKDFVITKETVIQKPVEVKITTKEETVTEEEVTPVVSETPVEEQPVVNEEVIDETVVEETPVEETIIETPVEETVIEETPVETIEENKEEIKEEEPVKEIPSDIPLTSNGTPKIIRIPFTVRMESADQGLRDSYNELKSLLKSYGLNNRVSNSGDTFRLHRVTYCKITIAGKSLKLYLALNPADYVDTTYPIKDASSKAIYRETPLVFKVKSGLSLRRAEELIRDCMDKHGLEQVKQLETRDWATDLNSVEFENDDFEDGDDEE